MLPIICAWIFWFLISLSIGAGASKLLSRIIGRGITFNYNIFYIFWLGFATIIGLLQIISLFLPIANIAFIIICMIALAGLIINARTLWAGSTVFLDRITSLKGILCFLGIIILLLFVSYAANKEVTHTDTFIYHYNAVKWVKEYSVVPGLVNLHPRLGFNSSFFLFAALTEIGMYSGYSSQIALSFLMVVCLIHWCWVILNPHSTMPMRIFCMMTFVFLVIHTLLKMDIASLATDYPMAVLTLVFCLVLIDKVPYKGLLLLALSGIAFTFKLSGIPAVGIALLAVVGRLIYVKYRGTTTNAWKHEIKLVATSSVVLFVIVSGFVIRNIVVSGWLLYPFPVGNLHLPWSSPEPYVSDIIDWIKSYPKIPGGASPETIRENTFWYWFTQWFSRFIQTFEYFMFFTAMFFLVWSAAQASRLSRFIYANLSIVLLFLFAILSLVFWFTSAPDVRFGSVYFYILFAVSIMLVYESSNYKHILKVAIYAGFAFMVVYHTPAYSIDRHPLYFTLAHTTQPRLIKARGTPAGENPPLVIYMPAEGNQCGDSPLPCTPYAGGLLHKHQVIRQRVPGNLSKGFLPPINNDINK